MTTIGRRSAKAAPSRAVLTLRLIMVGLAALAVLLAFYSARDRSVQQARYVCPMHPEVTSTTPSTCPICGMNLEPVVIGKPNAIKSSNYLTYDIARRRAYGPDALAPAWVEDDGSVSAILYLDEIAFRTPGEHAVFFPTSAPAEAVDVMGASDAPVPWDRSTARVHFRPTSTALRSGETGWLRRPRSPEPPVVPASAILEESAGPYVLVATGAGHALAKRPVEVGRVFGGVAAVLSGLGAADRVLTGSAFFVDAERRLRVGSTIDIAPR